MPDILAFPATAPASDAEARAAALNIEKSFIVEAPAGSGKTGLLVQRYLKLLADEATLAPEEVLAVTFTRKATAELRERVLSELRSAHDNVPVHGGDFHQTTRTLALHALAHAQQLGWDLLTQPLRLSISTFDSVAMQLANALPVLSGSGGVRNPVEDASALYHLAARRTLLQLGADDTTLHSALRNLLLHRDGNLADCEALLAEMLSTREQWAELLPLEATLTDDFLDAVVRPRLERALESIVCSALQRALDHLPAPTLQELTTVAQQLSTQPGYKFAPSPIALCADKHAPPAAVAAHLDHWTALISILLTKDSAWRRSFNVNHVGFTVPDADKAALLQLIADIQTEPIRASLESVRNLPPARYPDDQWRVARSLFHILRRALAELKLLFASTNECDFTELALAARQALLAADHEALEPDAPDLALTTGGRLRHLLIDEMQDTSAAQYTFIQLLTRFWDGHSQTLFLVGDPKQSIYLFRAARVERFLRTMHQQRLGDLPLTPLRLTANFRSQPALVADFNHAFSTIFLPPNASSDDTADVPFVAASATRPSTHTAGILWHTTILDTDPQPNTPTHAELEAQQVLTLIQHRLAMPLPADRKLDKHGHPEPWKIAVLGYGRRHLSAVITALHAAHLPFKATDLDPLNERPEVLDCLALTRALLHPADRTAWLAVLHAPWCGLGLADLLTLTGEDPTTRRDTLATLVPAHRHLLTPDAQLRLDRVWPVLTAATSSLGRTSLATHVERTWRSLGGDAWLSADQHTNVLRYLTLLRDLTANGTPLDLEVLTARLQHLYAEPFTGPTSIELCTIHKSKGLEWDMVLVPGLERGSGKSDPPLLNWQEFDPADPGEQAAVLLAPINRKGTSTGQLNQYLNKLRSRRLVTERKRLFYVACTRAKEELHLFAARKQQKNGLGSGSPSSLLYASLPAFQEHFAPSNAATDQVPQGFGSESALATDQVPQGFSLGSHTAIMKKNGALAPEEQPLALAASADPTPPILERLPLTFNPLTRFTNTRPLTYTPASALPHSTPFDRPEGSFAVRAFGNVVHRYLQLLAQRLIQEAPATLLAELPNWLPRLTTSLRGEGLAATLATREATRALHALTLTLNDPTGLWLLTPHPAAASETDLTTITTTLRFDRTFLAGPTPLSTGDTHIWIVDFKTTEPGSRTQSSLDAFAEAQLTTYTPQLEAYATLRRTLPDGHKPIQLALYYPLIPRLLHQPSKEVGNRK